MLAGFFPNVRGAARFSSPGDTKMHGKQCILSPNTLSTTVSRERFGECKFIQLQGSPLTVTPITVTQYETFCLQ